MDTDRFDDLTRVLSASPSRRGVLAALLGGSLGVLGLAETEAKKRGKGKGKKKGGNNPPTARECSVDADCPADANGQCLCDLEGLCFTRTGGFNPTSCAQCPTGTVECERVSGGFSCFARCGA